MKKRVVIGIPKKTLTRLRRLAKAADKAQRRFATASAIFADVQRLQVIPLRPELGQAFSDINNEHIRQLIRLAPSEPYTGLNDWTDAELFKIMRGKVKLLCDVIAALEALKFRQLDLPSLEEDIERKFAEISVLLFLQKRLLHRIALEKLTRARREHELANNEFVAARDYWNTHQVVSIYGIRKVLPK